MTARLILRKIHIYIAVFLAPFVFFMSLSGALELLGIEGDTERELIHVVEKNLLDFKSPTLLQDVRVLMKKVGVTDHIKSLRKRKKYLYTRPNYAISYSLKRKKGKIKIYKYRPDFVRRFMSLHKGNGSAFYVLYQKVLVFGFMGILLIGLWLGLSSSNMRKTSIVVMAAGSVVYIIAMI